MTLSPLPLGLTRVIHCVYCILQSSRRIRVSISQSGAVYVMLDGAVLPLTEETLWAVYVLPDERVSVNAIRPVCVLVDGNSSQTTKARLLLVSLLTL